MKSRFLSFVTGHSDCFERTCKYGHITASAWLMDSRAEKALLTHHKKLGMWLQLGGHADGETDIASAALREAKEESGIENIRFLTPEIFDLDVHLIPANSKEPAHYHFDVRFLLQAVNDQFQISEESLDLAWMNPEQLQGQKFDDSLRGLAAKWDLFRESVGPFSN